jgi:hypothetical protein
VPRNTSDDDEEGGGAPSLATAAEAWPLGTAAEAIGFAGARRRDRE